MSVTAAPRRDSLFLRHVRAAMLLDLEPEVVLCERIAVLRASGYKPIEIRRMLGTHPADYSRAEARLKRAAERLDAGD